MAENREQSLIDKTQRFINRSVAIEHREQPSINLQNFNDRDAEEIVIEDSQVPPTARSSIAYDNRESSINDLVRKTEDSNP